MKTEGPNGQGFDSSALLWKLNSSWDGARLLSGAMLRHWGSCPPVSAIAAPSGRCAGLYPALGQFNSDGRLYFLITFAPMVAPAVAQWSERIAGPFCFIGSCTTVSLTRPVLAQNQEALVTPGVCLMSASSGRTNRLGVFRLGVAIVARVVRRDPSIEAMSAFVLYGRRRFARLRRPTRHSSLGPILAVAAVPGHALPRP